MDYTMADKEWIEEKAFEISLHRGWPMEIARLEALARFSAMLDRPKAIIHPIWAAAGVETDPDRDGD